VNTILELARILSLLLAIPAAFTLAAWLAYRRYGLGMLALVWAVSSIAYGYLSFRATCSRPVTCDVGPDRYSFYYLTHVAPPYTVAAALAFGAIASVIVLRSRQQIAAGLRASDWLWGTLAGVAVFMAVAPIIKAPVW